MKRHCLYRVAFIMFLMTNNFWSYMLGSYVRGPREENTESIVTVFSIVLVGLPRYWFFLLMVWGMQTEVFNKRFWGLECNPRALAEATKAAIDAGWYYSQVRQTGDVISSEASIVYGILRSICHLAGIQGKEVITTIEGGLYIPIIKRSDFGIVGNDFKILPDLIQEVSNLSGV